MENRPLTPAERRQLIKAPINIYTHGSTVQWSGTARYGKAIHHRGIANAYDGESDYDFYRPEFM